MEIGSYRHKHQRTKQQQETVIPWKKKTFSTCTIFTKILQMINILFQNISSGKYFVLEQVMIRTLENFQNNAINDVKQISNEIW